MKVNGNLTGRGWHGPYGGHSSSDLADHRLKWDFSCLILNRTLQSDAITDNPAVEMPPHSCAAK